MRRPDVIKRLEKFCFPRYIPYDEVYVQLYKIYAGNGWIVLHLGAGSDRLQIYKIKEGNLNFVSLDIDFQQLSSNTNRRKVQADANRLPFRDEVFDLILSDAFFEHVKTPKSILLECFRVSKKRSLLMFTTPNRFSYISIFNFYMPKFIKDIAKRFRADAAGYFPAFYRFNTRQQIYSISKSAGYSVRALNGYVVPPSYFNFSIALWISFAGLHKIIENIGFLSYRFNQTFLGVLERD